MRVRRKTTADGISVAVVDYSRAKCMVHGGKLRDCHCPMWMADDDWMAERSVVRFRRLGRLYARRRDEAVLAAIRGVPPAGADGEG